MTSLPLKNWPQAIAHIDGDAFFASIEQALHPALRGCPVITGAERGIVVAASYEAQAHGIKRGIPLSEVTHRCPTCMLLPSNYEAYNLFSKRMFALLRRFSPMVEVYSIDEGFIDLTGTRRLHHTGYRDIGYRIQAMIEQELGITVSVGISLSKSLAKICSKFRKPHGLTAVKNQHIPLLLKQTPLGKVWGFGPSTTALLNQHGLATAFDFTQKSIEWVDRLLGKKGREIWRELHGEPVFSINPNEKTKQASISKMRTFAPPSSDRSYLKAQALRNLEAACIKARTYHLAAQRLTLLLRTQHFESVSVDMRLEHSSSLPLELAEPLYALLEKIFRPQTLYRATCVTCPISTEVTHPIS